MPLNSVVMGAPRRPHRLTLLERLKARGMPRCAPWLCFCGLPFGAYDCRRREPARPPAKPSGEVEALHERAAELYRARKYVEAMPIAQQALALGEQRFGPDDARLGKLLYGVALLHDVQGRYAEAEPFYQRTLAVLEKARGPDHVSVGQDPQRPRRSLHAPETPCRRRAALPALPCRLGKGIGIRSRGCGRPTRRARSRLSGAKAFRRRRPALPARARHQGKERRVPRTRMWPPR